MKQLRLPVYEIPHKAIRNALSQLSLLAGKTNYNEKHEVEKLSSMSKEIFRLLISHAEHENSVPLKYLEKKLPGGSIHDKEDHVKIDAEIAKLEDRLKFITESVSKEDDITKEGNDFYESVSDFHAKYLEHMLEEERETQPLLWKFFSDEELKQQEGEIMSNIPPVELLQWVKYLMPAFGNAGRTELLKVIKSMAPKEFFDEIMKVTESVIPENEFSKLKKSLV